MEETLITDNIRRSIFQQTPEKTFIDKVLDRADVERMRELMRKPRLSREDMLEILYLLSSVESKLLNFGEWDRYVILKFFVWVREFAKVAELMFDYYDDLEKKAAKNEVSLSPRTRQLLENSRRMMEHNVKFMVDLYLNICRTTLSLGATGILEILKNKYEITYPQATASQPSADGKVSIFGVKK